MAKLFIFLIAIALVFSSSTEDLENLLTNALNSYGIPADIKICSEEAISHKVLTELKEALSFI